MNPYATDLALAPVAGAFSALACANQPGNHLAIDSSRASGQRPGAFLLPSGREGMIEYFLWGLGCGIVLGVLLTLWLIRRLDL